MSDMNEFMREVQEDLRQEKIEKIWHEHGKKIVWTIVGILACTSTYVLWDNYQSNKLQRESLAYEQAVSVVQSSLQGDRDEALKQLQSLEKDGSAYAPMAALQKAKLLMSNQDTEKDGIKAYYEISQNKSFQPIYRHLALYYAILHDMNFADPADLLQKLPVLMVGSNPWSILALELQILLTWKVGQIPEAIELCDSLLNNPALRNNDHMRMRIEAYLGRMNGE